MKVRYRVRPCYLGGDGRNRTGVLIAIHAYPQYQKYLFVFVFVDSEKRQKLTSTYEYNPEDCKLSNQCKYLDP